MHTDLWYIYDVGAFSLPSDAHFDNTEDNVVACAA